MSEQRPVALGIQTPEQLGAAPANPLAPMSSMVDVMRGMASLRQQNAEWMARGQIAETVAGARDPVDAQQKLMMNPSIAAYAPQLITDYNNGVLAWQHGQNVTQTMAQSGMEGAMRAIFGTVDHPELLHDQIGAQLAALSPEARARDEPYLRSIEQGLLAGLPPDIKQWTDNDRLLYNQHVMGFGIAGKVDPAQAYPLMGIPGPQLTEPGRIPYSPWQPSSGAYGGVPRVGVGGAPTVPGVGGPAGAPGAISALPRSPKAADGTDLWSPGDFTGGRTTTTGLGGKVIFGTEAAEKLHDRFYTGDMSENFDNLNLASNQIAEFNHDLDSLVRPGGGGFTEPGKGGVMRSELANALLTAGRVIGINDEEWQKIGIDPSKVASAQDMQKVHGRMAFGVGNLFFGRGREAAQTVQRTFEAVPGIENTPLGAKLMVSNIQAQVDMARDERAFMLQWSNLHGGDMMGAQDKFYAIHNPTNYANQALRNFGIDPTTHRFTSWDVVGRYIDSGYLKASDVTAMRGIMPPGRPPGG